jgi:hypothetical protein
MPTGLVGDCCRKHDMFVPPNSTISIALNGSFSIHMMEPYFCDRWVPGEDPPPILFNYLYVNKAIVQHDPAGFPFLRNTLS